MRPFTCVFYMLFYNRKIEEKRGVTLTDSGMPQVKASFPDGLQSEALKKASGTVSSAAKSSASWDEDWGPTVKAPANSSQIQQSTIPISSNLPYANNQAAEVTSMQPRSSLLSQQTASTCPPVDIEWPPRAASGMAPKLGDGEKQKLNSGPSTSSFDDLVDPFADWPPRPGGSGNVSGPSNNGKMTSSYNKYGSSSNPGTLNDAFQTNSNISWVFDTQKLVEPSRQNQGNSTFDSSSFSNGVNFQNSIGFLKQNQGSSTLGSDKDKKTDLGSIFTSGKNDHAAPRLAPPPATAVGRGRGKGRGNQGHPNARPTNAKSSSEQPPLLDLL